MPSLLNRIREKCLPMLLLCSMLFVSGCSQLIRTPVTHQKVQPSEFDREFSPEELRSDLDFLLKTFESVHPNLYANVSREEIDAIKARSEAEITEPMTRVRFYPLVTRIVSRINDSHTSGGFPFEEWNAYVNSEHAMFPLGVDYAQEKLVVTRVVPEGSQITVGDEIRTINNVSTTKMVDAFFDQVGGDRNAQASSVGRRFHQILWTNDIHAPFDIEYVRAGGTPMTARESGLSQSQIAGRGEQKPTPPSPTNEKPPPPTSGSRNYRYERIEPNIAYIDFRQMVEPEKFEKFLRTTFKDIHDNPPNGLIIDMRRNGGGDSSLGQSLFEYITDKPYKMMGRKEWKASPEYKQYLRNHMAPAIRWMPLHLLHPIGWKFLCAPDGKIVVFGSDAHKPARRAHRFDGPVCFLIGSGTFSSAMMTADAVAEFDLATLIGEETGGRPNGFGEIYSFDLPHTRLNINVSSALFVRASGDESDPRGVLPDIEVKRTAEDRAKGIDTVLERAKTWVMEQASQSGT